MKHVLKYLWFLLLLLPLTSFATDETCCDFLPPFSPPSTGTVDTSGFTADAQTQLTPTTAIVLDEATGDEEAFSLFGEIDKATSGDTRGIYGSWKYTNAPGSNYVLDLGTNSATDGGVGTHTSVMTVDTAGNVILPAAAEISSSGSSLSLDSTNIIYFRSSGAVKAQSDGTGFNVIAGALFLKNGVQIKSANNGSENNASIDIVAQIAAANTTTGSVNLDAGDAKVGNVSNLIGGAVNLTAGDGTSDSAGDAGGGSINLAGGTGYGTGDDGSINVNSVLAVLNQDLTVTTEADISLSKSLLLLTGDNDSDNDIIDLQDGQVAGQTLIIHATALIDADDTITVAMTDTTCTGCATVLLDEIGDSWTLFWTGTTWAISANHEVP